MSNNLGWICPNCGMGKSPYSTQCCVRKPQLTFQPMIGDNAAYLPYAKLVTSQQPLKQGTPFDEELTL